MTFFYDLNKRMADLATKQDAQQLAENSVTAPRSKSQLTESLQMAEADYSAKKARAGKDIGKPGKMFSKIAKSAGKEYGSKAAGERVAGAVLNKLRAKESVSEGSMKDAMHKDAERMSLDKFVAKYGDESWVRDFYNNTVGPMDETASKALTLVRKNLAPYAEEIADIIDQGRLAVLDDNFLDNPNDIEQYTTVLLKMSNLFRRNPIKGLEYLGTLWSEIQEMTIGEIRDQLKIDLGQMYNQAFPNTGRSFEEGNAFGDAVLKAKADGVQKGEKVKVGGKTYPVKEAGKPMTPKQKSFAKLAPPTDKITFADKIAGAKQEVDEMLGDVAAEAMKSAVKRMGEADVTGLGEEDFEEGVFGGGIMGGPLSMNNPLTTEEEMAEGFKEMHAWLKSREAEKGTGRFDKKKISTGTVYTRKPETFASDDEETSDAPRGRGRPKGKDKGPERVTAKSYKYKSGRPAKAMEGDMDPADSGEYDREGDMAKEQMHTIMSAAKELHGMLKDEENLPEWVQKKITLAKEYIDTARDYMLSQHAERAEEEPIAEKAVSKKQQKFMGMVHAAQKGKKPASGEVAKVAKTMKKSDATDFAATKHKGLPEKVKAKKEEKVEEIAVGGGNKSSESPNHKISGMEVGKGVYEGLNRQFAQALTEGMSITANMSAGEEGDPRKSITVTADGDDANKLAELLKMAGLDSSAYEQEPCAQCGSSSCGCGEIVDENKPDWPTNVETSDDALQYSGGLNGKKSTGQTTIPVIASQLRRQVSMEEGVELERSLFKLYKDFTTK